MVTCKTILGSWQDILRKTFLASRNKTTKRFCQCLSMRLAVVSVHQGLALGTSRPSIFPWPFPPTTLFIAAWPPHGCIPAPSPMPSSVFLVLHQIFSAQGGAITLIMWREQKLPLLGLQEALRKQEAMSVLSHGNGFITHIPSLPGDWLCNAKY